jgi:hypothetical protein
MVKLLQDEIPYSCEISANLFLLSVKKVKDFEKKVKVFGPFSVHLCTIKTKHLKLK